jgi:hypothetical protein
VFDYPTIGGLAEYLVGQLPDAESSSDAGSPSDAESPSVEPPSVEPAVVEAGESAAPEVELVVAATESGD